MTNEEIKILQETLVIALKDTKRLDWLADPNNYNGDVALPTWITRKYKWRLRDAIDAAMAIPSA